MSAVIGSMIPGLILMHLVVAVVAFFRYFFHDKDGILLLVSLIFGWLGVYILAVLRQRSR